MTVRGQQVINVQFTDSYSQEGLNGQSWSSIIAPFAYTGTTWTQAGAYSNFGASALLYSGGGSSTVGFTVTGNPALSNNDGFATEPLLREIEYSGGDLTLTISGLQNGQAYNLALACAWNGADGSAFTIGSNTHQDTGANIPTFTEGVNYVEFADVTATDNSIVVTIAPNGDGQNFANINGFQLEVAPEPSTWAMMFGGLALLGLCVRRKLA